MNTVFVVVANSWNGSTYVKSVDSVFSDESAAIQCVAYARAAEKKRNGGKFTTTYEVEEHEVQ